MIKYVYFFTYTTNGSRCSLYIYVKSTAMCTENGFPIGHISFILYIKSVYIV